MVLHQGQQLGSQIQQVKKSQWSKYMSGTQSKICVGHLLHSPHSSGAYEYFENGERYDD